MSKLLDKLIADGYCDSRGAGFCATATKLPRGEYGIVCLCVNGNILSLYDVDMRNNLGQCLYQITLSKIENLKIRAMLLSQVLKFTYEGDLFSFTNFVGVKPALKIIEEESKKR